MCDTYNVNIKKKIYTVYTLIKLYMCVLEWIQCVYNTYCVYSIDSIHTLSLGELRSANLKLLKLCTTKLITHFGLVLKDVVTIRSHTVEMSCPLSWELTFSTFAVLGSSKPLKTLFQHHGVLTMVARMHLNIRGWYITLGLREKFEEKKLLLLIFQSYMYFANKKKTNNKTRQNLMSPV